MMDEKAILRRLADLEGQVAELMEWKREIEEEERRKLVDAALQKHPDVVVYVKQGMKPIVYCRSCYEKTGNLFEVTELNYPTGGVENGICKKCRKQKNIPQRFLSSPF